MTLFGNGRAALLDDPAGAERLGWPRRRRSHSDPKIVVQPRDGDPTREPWVAPSGWRPTPGAAALWTRPRPLGAWTYLPQANGVYRYLERLSRQPRGSGAVVGISGLGRVGGTAAAVLASLATRRSGIAELLIHDGDAATQERWFLELGSIAGWGGDRLPDVRSVGLGEMLARCDAFVFSAAAEVPAVGCVGDVRLPQFASNREILQAALAAARIAEFSGLFLMVSDPVECLAQAAFVDSNSVPDAGFTGAGLAPERIAGLALGVMWGRALAAARVHGWETDVARTGVAYGPHSTEVLVFDSGREPDTVRSRVLSEAARRGNYRLRELGFLPYVGPAVSSIALTLPRLLAGRQVLASALLDGVFFGAPARLGWGIHPMPRVLAPGVRQEIAALYALLRARLRDYGLIPGKT